jgi:L-alanine-DL-glutamate epimerase-like enolase superfamily enzyme
MSGGGLGFLYAAHFASFAPAHGPHQEYKGVEDLPVSSPTAPLRAVKGVVTVPSGAGLGVVYEPRFLASARAQAG